MIVTRFRSVGWAAGVAVAALGCYLVSQRVATERAVLAKVEGRILTARRDIRQLQTEIGTRGRMGQLEQWNGDVLALSAPEARQFVESEVHLASLNAAPLPLDPKLVVQQGTVQLAGYDKAKTAPPAAALPAPVPAAAAPAPAEPLLRQATYIKPKGDRMMPEPTKIALLPADLLGDINRIAARESGSKKRAQ